MDSEEHSLHLHMNIMAERFFDTPKYFNILRNTSSYLKSGFCISEKQPRVLQKGKKKKDSDDCCLLNCIKCSEKSKM